MATEQEHFNAARQFQEFYDQTLRKIGAKAPQPVLGTSVNDYRRETLRNLKRTFLPAAHELSRPNYRGMPADALAVFEPQLLTAVVAEANNPAHVPPGELKKIERLDDYGKVKCIEFVGQEHFTKQMSRPGRHVAQFITNHGRYNVAKARYE